MATNLHHLGGEGCGGLRRALNTSGYAVTKRGSGIMDAPLFGFGGWVGPSYPIRFTFQACSGRACEKTESADFEPLGGYPLTGRKTNATFQANRSPASEYVPGVMADLGPLGLPTSLGWSADPPLLTWSHRSLDEKELTAAEPHLL